MTTAANNACVIAMGLFSASGILLFAGCSDGTQEAWQAAYRAYYDQAYEAAVETGPTRGAQEGALRGAERARHGVTAGRGWQLYAPFVYGAVFPGIVVGLVVQYSILFNFRLTERLPPALFAFVPAMKASLCYKIFERRFRLMVDFDEQINKLLAARNLDIAKGDAAYKAMRRRILAATSIDELSTARFVEIADNELTRIIADAADASEAEKRKRTAASGKHSVCKCPQCGKGIQFSQKMAGKTTKCPHPKCGAPVTLTAIE